MAIFDDGRLEELIFLRNSADPDSNKYAPLKVGFVGGGLGLSLGGAPSVKYTYQSGGAEFNVADGAGPLVLVYSDRTGDSALQGGKLGDFIYGGSGNDVLNGGGGDDTLIGNLGTNIIRGGAGNNTASYVGYGGPNSPDTLGVQVFLDEREAYDRKGFVFHDTLIDIQNAVGTRFLDILVGDAGDNILEGLNGADIIRGGAGIDTSSYETSAFSVDVNLTQGQRWWSGVGDILESIENVRGSRLVDSLTGDAKANVLEGGKEADQLFGAGGSDTASYEHSLIGVSLNLATGSNTGGDAQGDILTDIEIEAVYVRDALTLDMSGVSTKAAITVQNAATTLATVTGTEGNDTITAGVGDAVIDGSSGSDKLYAGAGTDTFTVKANVGRDNVYGFESGADHFDVSALVTSFKDINLSELNGGVNTLITFEGAGSGNKIILHDVAKGSLSEADFGFLI